MPGYYSSGAGYQNFRRHATQTNQGATRARPRAWASERDFAVNGSAEIMRGLPRPRVGIFSAP
jgi:hypothetical protein